MSKISSIFASQNKIKTVRHIFLSIVFAIIGAVCVVPNAYADAKKQGDKAEQAQGSKSAQSDMPRWGKKANRSTGLYTVKNRSIGNGVCVGVNMMYYYGDIDQLDQAFLHGFQPQNLSFGGGLAFAYLHPQGRFINWRFSLNAGYLHGNDSTRKAENKAGEMVMTGKGQFRNIFGEAAAGVEFYPFPRAGFYIYAGLGLSIGYIDYNFFNTKIPAGTTVSVLPMLPVEIGYNFYLGRSCFLGISLGVHQGLVDMANSNLDAWPVKSTSVFQWGDGYFQVGVSFSYRWHNCEVCRHLKW